MYYVPAVAGRAHTRTASRDTDRQPRAARARDRNAAPEYFRPCAGACHNAPFARSPNVKPHRDTVGFLRLPCSLRAARGALLLLLLLTLAQVLVRALRLPGVPGVGDHHTPRACGRSSQVYVCV